MNQVVVYLKVVKFYCVVLDHLHYIKFITYKTIRFSQDGYQIKFNLCQINFNPLVPYTVINYRRT